MLVSLTPLIAIKFSLKCYASKLVIQQLGSHILTKWYTGFKVEQLQLSRLHEKSRYSLSSGDLYVSQFSALCIILQLSVTTEPENSKTIEPGTSNPQNMDTAETPTHKQHHYTHIAI